MKKIKLQINETITKEVEIETPLFVKNVEYSYVEHIMVSEDGSVVTIIAFKDGAVSVIVGKTLPDMSKIDVSTRDEFIGSLAKLNEYVEKIKNNLI